ncbi:DNA-binding protein [Salipaludibacillus agaradhaerens]|uniref:DNA-binding protein n=1 Tax=Salipaludibacillus agaradhaerens TaxID=76935 RepID=UPI002151378D|nr:DNA-binding protein [Salipaludibacillus agaradhaerens]MCR6105051.1 DNA-binding protein [Salipaludibacillus agaradhaerens]MCR6117096.1 DNA-binding protein [Salipaludibacillus agaradhaerens]
MDAIILALGIAGAGYFIGSGLENFKSEQPGKGSSQFFEDESEQLIKDTDLHHYTGLSKEDARSLINAYPDVPHMKINGNVYYHKKNLDDWLMTLSDKKISK